MLSAIPVISSKPTTYTLEYIPPPEVTTWDIILANDLAIYSECSLMPSVMAVTTLVPNVIYLDTIFLLSLMPSVKIVAILLPKFSQPPSRNAFLSSLRYLVAF